jgi:hypothetical protein
MKLKEPVIKLAFDVISQTVVPVPFAPVYLVDVILNRVGIVPVVLLVIVGLSGYIETFPNVPSLLTDNLEVLLDICGSDTDITEFLMKLPDLDTLTGINSFVLVS